MREPLGLSATVGCGFCLRESLHGLERPVSAKRKSKFPSTKRGASGGGDTHCPGDMEFQETIAGRLGLSV